MSAIASRQLGGRTTEHLLVRRLVRLYPWFFDEPIYETMKLADVLRQKSRPYLDEDARPNTLAWHVGRVRALYDELSEGKTLDPISVTNHYSGEPVLRDGHHRLAAHWFARRKTIPAYYHGREDLLDYLTARHSYSWLMARA